jgi:hypothetical protein
MNKTVPYSTPVVAVQQHKLHLLKSAGYTVQHMNRRYSTPAFLLAVAVQQHKLHLNKERCMHSAANEQDGTVQPAAVAVQQHRLHLNKERWMHRVQ